ncbi:MAG TPA: FAD-binding oxidoreductase [Flavisolibacter sp.]|nr:FAD-binding oxidoreductase [Flavisolibacter sp.]
MQTDVLIIGQGLCGTMLSWHLHKEGKSFVVIDEEQQDAPSRVAAGVINPVTGRRYSITWMVEELFPYAKQVYEELGNYLGTNLFYQKNIIDFFPTPQMRNTFVDRLTENDTYLHSYPDQNRFNQYFNYDFGCGEIGPAYMADVATLLAQWRNKLKETGRLKEEKFIVEDLVVTSDGITYQNITAEKIVFCDGTASTKNPWFELLPFSPNKGEALIIECEELTNDHIFKRGMMLAPLPTENLFWVGSTYQWDLDDIGPSEKFYKSTTALLEGWLKKPFKVLDHKAAFRPATVERRPFVGFHPLYPAIGILNGMGSKGTSLSPFFANQLVQHYVHDLPITPEADVHRFQRILSK